MKKATSHFTPEPLNLDRYGDTGIFSVKRSGQSLVGYHIPRSQYDWVKKNPSLKTSGVYILINDEIHPWSVYVGSSMDIPKRLGDHVKNKKWNGNDVALVFVSTDNDALHNGVIAWIENELHGKIERIGKYKVMNAEKPHKGKCSVPIAESFLTEFCKFISVLGYPKFFDSPALPVSEPIPAPDPAPTSVPATHTKKRRPTKSPYPARDLVLDVFTKLFKEGRVNETDIAYLMSKKCLDDFNALKPVDQNAATYQFLREWNGNPKDSAYNSVSSKGLLQRRYYIDPDYIVSLGDTNYCFTLQNYQFEVVPMLDFIDKHGISREDAAKIAWGAVPPASIQPIR